MVDMVKCDDSECPRKLTCSRFLATPSKWQSFFVTSPKEGINCEYYIDAKNLELKLKIGNKNGKTN
jgi:hypothetical protein